LHRSIPDCGVHAGLSVNTQALREALTGAVHGYFRWKERVDARVYSFDLFSRVN
jgi:hypothetical protein